MKNQKIISGFLGVVMVLLASCDDLTEVNKSPDQLIASDINIKYVLTTVISATARGYIFENVYGNGGATLSETVQYLQRDYIDSQGPNTFVWSPRSFSGFNMIINNCQYLCDNAKNDASANNQKFYLAAGLIMRSFWYGFLTSAYGEIPYTEAMKAKEGNFSPVFDSQKVIFKGVLNDLKSANDILGQITSVDDVASADIMYGGDVVKWRKLANSLRLRFLMRLSEKASEMEGIDVKAEFNSIVGNSTGNPIFSSNSDNAAISYVGTNNTNSWYGGPLAFPNRSEFYRRKPCATFVDELRKNLDPRLTVFIRPVDTQLKLSSATPVYRKLPDGQIIRNIPPSTPGADKINTYRYVGLPVALPDPNIYNLAGTTDYNAIKALNPGIYLDLGGNPNVSYLSNIYSENANPLVKAVYMSFAELNFILAEARLKGWITSGNMADFYKAGILSSLEQYKIANGNINVYNPDNDELIAFDQNAFISGMLAKLNNATNDTERLGRILTQKWLACFMTPEFWFDWRRTGLPDLGANVIAGSKGNKIPIRYIYGDDEKILNNKNMMDAIGRLTPSVDDQWSKMWLVMGTNKPW